jgi:hypothetical protein
MQLALAVASGATQGWGLGAGSCKRCGANRGQAGYAPISTVPSAAAAAAGLGGCFTSAAGAALLPAGASVAVDAAGVAACLRL